MIDILLSTYNSEKYLEEQINSIINQSNEGWNLLIRDDGSSDNTLQIISKYIDRFSTKIFLTSSGENIGIVKSYETLLRESKSEYVMFCDHDDVWLPDKIQLTLDKMTEREKENPNQPILIHTDLKIVDNRLNEIHSSFWKLLKIKPSKLTDFNLLSVYNYVTGCTVMINKEAKRIVLPFADCVRMHDYWIALCVAKSGIIDVVNRQTILYRQHSENELGVRNLKVGFSLKKIINENTKQINMLQKLGEVSITKYLLYKFIFFKKRIWYRL